MKIRPLEDGVVIKQTNPEDKTTGGIILPDSAKEKPQTGTVIAVGPGRFSENGKLLKMSVKKNDKVIYAKYSGSEVELDGKKYVLLHERDILGIVEK